MQTEVCVGIDTIIRFHQMATLVPRACHGHDLKAFGNGLVLADFISAMNVLKRIALQS